MIKKTLLVTLAVLFVSIPAFAGEGSDTIGACKLMPEIRYGYNEADLTVDTYPYSYMLTRLFDWKTREQNGTVQVNWGVIDNLDLYAFVGAKIAAETVGTVNVSGAGDEIVFDIGNGFLCGVGVKGTFWRSPGGFYVGGGLSFAYSVTDDQKHLREYEYGRLVMDYSRTGSYFKEMSFIGTADIHAGWHFKTIGLTPYVGFEYRWMRSDLYLDGPSFAYNSVSCHPKYPVGVYVGLDYLIADRLSLNLEGHMVNRWGGSFSVGYLFDICGKPAPAAPAPAPIIEPKIEPMSKK